MDRHCKDVQHSIVREVDRDENKQTWVFRGVTPEPPIAWSITVGEILYNLRSALDHLVWQLVLANGQCPRRSNRFPITEDHEKWELQKVGALKGVCQEHQAKIGYLQPFTGGIGLSFDVSMLKSLDDLSNIEKHRHLILSVIASMGIEPLEFGVNHPDLDESISTPPLEGIAFLGKVETGRVLLTFNNADTELSPHLLIDVRFENVQPDQTRAITLRRTLDKCLATVKGSVDFITARKGKAF